MHHENAAFAVNTYSYTLTRSAAECARTLAAQGFSGLELMMYPGHLWPADMGAAERTRLRQELDSLGLRVLTLNMPNIDINVAAAAPEMRAHSLRLLTAAVQLAGDLGAGAVIVGPGKPNPLLPMPAAQMRGHFFRALEQLAPVAESAGTQLFTENMPFAFLPRVEQLMAALDEHGDERIGVVFDTANSHFIGEPVGPALQACGWRLRMVHVSDTDRAVYRHAPVGQGTLDFVTVAQAMRQLPSLPPTVLEVVGAEPEREIPDSADRLRALGWPAGPPAADRRPT